MKHCIFRRFCGCLMANQLAVLVAAQSPAPTAPQPQAPVIRTTSRLVQLNVVVQDKHGQPVAELTRDDFIVNDKGQPQRISLFSRESVEARTAPGFSPPALPAHYFSNRLEQTASVPTSVTIILIDSLNTAFLDMVSAREHVLKFLSQLQQNDRVALYLLGNGLRVLHDFTNDTAPLVRALERWKGRHSTTLGASEPSLADTGDWEFDLILNELNQKVADFYRTNRALATTRALEEIANHVARLPGRKNLLWVSGGFPLDIGLEGMSPTFTGDKRVFNPEVERAARALNSANLAVYPVDARGMIPAFSGVPRGISGRPRGPVGPITRLGGSFTATIDVMQVLADRTGGRAFYNTNDIKDSIRRAIEDSRVTYTLGYYPTHNQWDGKFRKVKVEVKRTGVHVRHRLGYFALPDVELTPRQRDAVLRMAAASPLDATGLGVAIIPEAMQSSQERQLEVRIGVDTRDLGLELQGSLWAGRLDLLFVQRSSEGKVLNSAGQNVVVGIPRESYDQALQNGLHFSRRITIQPSATELRVVIRDAVNGALGSVSLPLESVFPKRTG